jgi:hypothetical protein
MRFDRLDLLANLGDQFADLGLAVAEGRDCIFLYVGRMTRRVEGWSLVRGRGC